VERVATPLLREGCHADRVVTPPPREGCHAVRVATPLLSRKGCYARCVVTAPKGAVCCTESQRGCCAEIQQPAVFLPVGGVQHQNARHKFNKTRNEFEEFNYINTQELLPNGTH